MNMPLVLLNRRRRGNVFTPSGLFALSEPGVWYDPSDLTTLFTDTAGTQPVTTPGQTVALALDKSKGLVLGSELVTNGDFSSGTTGWTVGTNWSVSGGSASHAAGAAGELSQLLTIQSGMGYRVTFTISNLTAGSGYIQFAAGGFQNIFGFTTNGTYTVTVNSNAAYTRVGVVALSAASFTIDNISVRELSGFHATQATAASRPTYGIVPRTGRRNLLTFTEQFDNAAWANAAGTVSVTANTTTAPDGTMTADKLVPAAATNWMVKRQAITFTAASHVLSVWAKLSDAGVHLELLGSTSGGNGGAVFNLSTGAVITSAHCTTSVSADDGNGWRRYAIIFTPAAGSGIADVRVTEASTRDTQMTGNGSKGIFVWGAQLEAGSTATAYQRVGSAFDVTEAGVASLSYLSFDGVDDFLVTPTITPNIDKAQVFAGVRKLSDAATGIIVGYSPDAIANNGAFSICAPNVFSSVPYWSDLRGTSRIYTDTGSFGSLPAPRTNVLSFLYDIGEASAVAELRARVNGSAASLVYNGANAGTGNFLAYPLYIGRLGGTSFAFNGNIFSLIVRFGTNLDAGTITSTETWVNGKTGAYA